MGRMLNDWIETYLRYMQNTESATIFHRWVAMSVIAAVLRKKVKLSLGRINVYPNMYVVLVAPPGAARKSQAISFGIKFLSEIPDVILSADAVTPQALIQDLENSAVDEQMPDGSRFQHSSLTVTSKEFESFLGQKGDNTKMIVMLTDLFDAQEIPWKYRTKHTGTNVVPSVFLNVLAATTPESIASSLPSSAIGSGLTSRIIFVWATRRAKPVPIPIEDEEERELCKALKNDLYIISRIAGTYTFSPECRQRWIEWYNDYDRTAQLCPDPVFDGWYERKPLYLLKLAIVHAAARSNDLVVDWPHIEASLQDLEEVETQMHNVFKAVGRSLVAADVNLVVEIVKSRKWITERELMRLVWRDIDSKKFDNVMDTVLRQRLVKRVYNGPDGKPTGDIWYVYGG